MKVQVNAWNVAGPSLECQLMVVHRPGHIPHYSIPIPQDKPAGIRIVLRAHY
jgi:hypothetical protein